MEKRAILAAVLMAALLVIYQTFFFPASQEPTQKAPAGPSAPAPAPAAPAAVPAAPSAAAPKSAGISSAPGAPRPPQRLVPVDAPLYRAVVSSEGGKLQEFVLKYRGEKPMVMVGDLGPSGLLLAADPRQPGEPVPMTVNAEQLTVRPGRPGERLLLTGETDGLRVREALVFHPDGYSVDVELRIENPGPAPRIVGVALPWTTRERWPADSEKFRGQHPTEIVVSRSGHVEWIDDLTVPMNHEWDGDWIATGSVWYLAALVPKTAGFKLVATSEGKPPAAKNGDKAPTGRASVAVRATPTIAPGQAWEGRVVMYVGPKEYELLRAQGLEGAINFGHFPLPQRWVPFIPVLPMAWIGIPILLLLKWMYQHIGNYGIAIIVLTVLSKVLFYPLTVKSMRSMKAMQALQPQINALRSKYKSDPQRLQRETLELYRKHKVNPMGGCLPMIAQIPVFYALYIALSVSVELQNAKFICFGRLFDLDLWICDLAAQDPTYVLPILMGITMFVQQKMTPATGDPRQQKMMLLIMPAFFTMMFVNLASGLVLYWTVSNILQILQQWYMNRSAREAREAKDA
jgi:YidC/Oxa1 family membrane protein insertase